MLRTRMPFVVFVSVFLTVPVWSQEESLAKVVEGFSQTNSLRRAEWSVCARFVEGDSIIIGWNTEKNLAPASCQKLVTTAAGLEVLGEDYRFQTRIYLDGKFKSAGVFGGNLYVVGGGDPTLGSDLTPGSLSLDSLLSVWVGAVKSRGIREIRGAVFADDFAFDRIPIPDDWFWIDIGNYYATSISALTIHDNLYQLTFRPGKNKGDPAALLRVEPDIPGLRFVNLMKTGPVGSGDNGYIYCAPDQWKGVLRGAVPAGEEEFSIKGSIPNPPLYAAQAFIQALRHAGIRIRGKAAILEHQRSYDHVSLLTTTLSPPLRDIITIINKRSFNLYAEQLLKAIGVARMNEGSTGRGIETIEAVLDSLNVGHEGMQLADGCGLARTNGITTRTFVDLLSAMYRSPHFIPYYASLSIAGDSTDIGFFKDFGIGTEIALNARIKSGSIQGVRSYSGYVRDRMNRLIAFSCIANNYSGRAADVDAMHKQIILRLARLP